MIALTISCSITKQNNSTIEENKTMDTLQTIVSKDTASTHKRVTKELIKGNWEDKECVGCYSGSRTYYTFKDSTFTRMYFSWTDEVDNDECEIIRIYSAGKYFLKGKYLYLDGQFTDKTYKNKNTDKCGKKGNFKTEIEVYNENNILHFGFKYKERIPIKYWIKLFKK